MPTTDNDMLHIPNAAWWLPHSHVEIREDLLAEDQEWISNQSSRVVNAGTPGARVESSLGSASVLLVRRMVVQGVVAVRRSGGRIKTVQLPSEAGKLLSFDLEYIVTQIGKYNEPMTEDEQSDFLPSVNGHVGETSEMVK